MTRSPVTDLPHGEIDATSIGAVIDAALTRLVGPGSWRDQDLADRLEILARVAAQAAGRVRSAGVGRVTAEPATVGLRTRGTRLEWSTLAEWLTAEETLSDRYCRGNSRARENLVNHAVALSQKPEVISVASREQLAGLLPTLRADGVYPFRTPFSLAPLAGMTVLRAAQERLAYLDGREPPPDPYDVAPIVVDDPGVSPELALEAVARAISAGARSPCRKSQRGVAIFAGRSSTVVTNTNDPLLGCGNDDACRAACGEACVHAEESALIDWLKARQEAEAAHVLHVKVVDGFAVPSGPPSCTRCSSLLLQARVRRVWLLHADGWRGYEALKFHRLSLKAKGLRPDLTTEDDHG